MCITDKSNGLKRANQRTGATRHFAGSKLLTAYFCKLHNFNNGPLISFYMYVCMLRKCFLIALSLSVECALKNLTFLIRNPIRLNSGLMKSPKAYKKGSRLPFFCYKNEIREEPFLNCYVFSTRSNGAFHCVILKRFILSSIDCWQRKF